jgi:hypothetical protein
MRDGNFHQFRPIDGECARLRGNADARVAELRLFRKRANGWHAWCDLDICKRLSTA